MNRLGISSKRFSHKKRAVWCTVIEKSPKDENQGEKRPKISFLEVVYLFPGTMR
jgi:hypothetical protein